MGKTAVALRASSRIKEKQLNDADSLVSLLKDCCKLKYDMFLIGTTPEFGVF